MDPRYALSAGAVQNQACHFPEQLSRHPMLQILRLIFYSVPGIQDTDRLYPATSYSGAARCLCPERQCTASHPTSIQRYDFQSQRGETILQAWDEWSCHLSFSRLLKKSFCHPELVEATLSEVVATLRGDPFRDSIRDSGS